MKTKINGKYIYDVAEILEFPLQRFIFNIIYWGVLQANFPRI